MVDNPLDKLNARQHKFVLNLFSGMSQTEAYIQAGYEPCSREVAAVNASDLLTTPNVSLAYDALRRNATEEVGLTYEQCLETLGNIAQHPIEMPVSAGHKIAAVDKIAELKGLYPASRHLVAGKVQIEVIHEKRAIDAIG